ncbi:unnamed protein product [Brassica rapa subsp. trilocularis]
MAEDEPPSKYCDGGCFEPYYAGFSVEYKNVMITVWDVSGQEKLIKPLWRHYFNNTYGLVTCTLCIASLAFSVFYQRP